MRRKNLFTVIEQLSEKYNLDLRNMNLDLIKKKISSCDWERLTHAVKYGKEIY